jgi:DNA modification methylase
MSKRPPRKKKKEELVEQVMDAHQTLVEYNMETDEELREQFPANVEGSREFYEANEDIGLGVNQIHCGDTVETMNKLNDGCIDMILTSPPYLASIRKDNHKYPGAKNQIKDNQSVEDYLDWMSDADTGLRIYDTVAWKKKSAVPLSGHPNRMTRIVEMVYIFAKTPNFKANKIVKSISKTGQKYFTAYYNFIEAKNNDGKVEGHEATFSSDLAQYFIDLYTEEGDIVLDNFVGTGTTPYTAAKMDRKYIGIDLVEDYCEYSRNRVSKLYKSENPDQ